MRKWIGLILVVTALGLTSCGNRDMLDVNHTFNKAIIGLPDGENIEVKVKQWKDYTDGEQIQIITEDGTVYLTSSYNCILIKE